MFFDRGKKDRERHFKMMRYSRLHFFDYLCYRDTNLERKEKRIMTTIELTAELFRQLSIIAEDETLMRKAVKALRKLAQQKEEKQEDKYISKEEILAGIDAGLKDWKAGKTRPAEELLKELRNEL